MYFVKSLEHLPGLGPYSRLKAPCNPKERLPSRSPLILPNRDPGAANFYFFNIHSICKNVNNKNTLITHLLGNGNYETLFVVYSRIFPKCSTCSNVMEFYGYANLVRIVVIDMNILYCFKQRRRQDFGSGEGTF